ncbi:MAG: LacI family DNA-binding transcriptional regulator, partial [Brachybacterium sp.]|nr:LacI family DNA-binding transcriptional regulator [Brachybacterium sp.]
AGVSRATVSMVLNDRTKGTVSADTKAKVLAAAAELGYTRSAIALSLKEQRTRTIGLITDEIATSPWAGRMIRAASATAEEAGYMVLTVDLSLRSTDASDAVRALTERQVDGLLFATMGRTRVPMPDHRAGLPLVLLNCEPEEAIADDRDSATIPSFLPDDRGGARRAAQRLLEVGHRRVVMLAGDDDTVGNVERIAGYRHAMKAAGMEAQVVRAGWQMDDGYREMLRLLDGERPPTAVLCIRDRVAAGAIHAAAVRGVEVPDGLSVVGFDDEDFFAEVLTPPLSTLALPHEDMGRGAMQVLLGMIDGTDPVTDGARWPRVIACPLVERQTVGAPPLRA